MKSMKKIMMLVAAVTLFTGCGEAKRINDNGRNTQNKQSETNISAVEFPKSYDYETESGKVKFHCPVEIPDHFNTQSVHKMEVKGRSFGDQEKAYHEYVEGKSVVETHETFLGKDLPEEKSYRLADGSYVLIGNGFSYGSENVGYYTSLGMRDSEKLEIYKAGKVDFATDDEAKDYGKRKMEEIGYAADEFTYQVCPLQWELSKDFEVKQVEDQLILEEDRKDEWTQEDDAYFIYAYQMCEGLPVFHELMSVDQAFAYDTPDNAPMQAIYSTRGLEWLMTEYIYEFAESTELLTLKDFNEIANIVEVKFDNLLNDTIYEVTKAKLFRMVRLNEKQEYVAEPVWYFEVMENDTKQSITLINAVTGKEIFLNKDTGLWRK